MTAGKNNNNSIMTRALRVLIFVSLVLVSVVIYYLSHDVESGDNPVKIYFADNISPAHKALIKKFNAAYQGRIEVVPVDLPFSKFSTNERKELLARSLRSKSDRIDVFAVDLIWVPRFARWAEPLDIYFPMQQRSSIMSNALESCYFEDHLVGIPFYIDVGLMYYREDLLRKLPDYKEWQKRIARSLTWSELLTLSNRLKSKNGYTYLFAANNYEGLVCSFLDLIRGSGGGIVQGDSINLLTPEAIRSLNLLTDLVKRYKITPPEVTGYDEYQTYLYGLEYDVPFMRGWPGIKRHYSGNISHSEKLGLLQVAPLPHFAGARPASVFGGWNLMIPRTSRRKMEALEFLKFLLLPENQRILYEQGGYIPVGLPLYQQEEFINDNPELAAYRTLIENGFHRPKLVDYTKISDAISNYANQAIEGRLTVEDALRNATRSINKSRTIIKQLPGGTDRKQ